MSKPCHRKPTLEGAGEQTCARETRHNQSDGKFANGIIAGFVLLVMVVVS